MFLLFLPPILFGAGYFTSIRDFKANLRPILLLSVGLVLFTTTAVAIVVYWLVPELGWPLAFAIGRDRRAAGRRRGDRGVPPPRRCRGGS